MPDRRPLTEAEEATMAHLRRVGEASLTDLADHFGLTKSGMKARLGPMKASRYVTTQRRGRYSYWRAT